MKTQQTKSLFIIKHDDMDFLNYHIIKKLIGLHHESLQPVFPTPPVGHLDFEQGKEGCCMVGMQQMTHLMRNNIFNTGSRRLDQFRIQDNFPFGGAAAPTVFHFLNIE